MSRKGEGMVVLNHPKGRRRDRGEEARRVSAQPEGRLAEEKQGDPWADATGRQRGAGMSKAF